MDDDIWLQRALEFFLTPLSYESFPRFLAHEACLSCGRIETVALFKAELPGNQLSQCQVDTLTGLLVLFQSPAHGLCYRRSVGFLSNCLLAVGPSRLPPAQSLLVDVIFCLLCAFFQNLLEFCLERLEGLGICQGQCRRGDEWNLTAHRGFVVGE
ncbi:hypothetical protein BO221_20830 [Archangium sp. Cb G35]|nr:hypothetical protein BO221_20830 [Archangium sp. Cb G35]